MKKIIASLLVFMIFPILVMADGKMEFVLNKEQSTSEEEIEISLELKNNPGFGYLGVEIVFDQDKLEYISSSVVGMPNAILKGASLNNEGNISVYALQVDIDKLIDDNDIILNATFKKKEEFLNTTISLENISIGKDENNPIEYTIKNLEIKNDIKEDVTLKESKSLKEEVSSYLDEDVKYEDIEWKSTNEDVVEIIDGKIVFKKAGDATVIGQVAGKTVFEKQFSVKKEFNYLYIVIPVAMLVIGLGAIIFIKRKNKKKIRSEK